MRECRWLEFCYLNEMTRCVLYLTRHKEVQEAAREEVTTSNLPV